jgi:hypothetical protein
MDAQRSVKCVTLLRVLKYVIERCSSDEKVSQFLSGAFVVIQDNGALWRAIRKRNSHVLGSWNPSSHYSNSDQIRFGVPGIFEALAGTKPQFITSHGDVKSCTWIQLENSVIGVAHIYDYMYYVAANKNVGPFGTSVHTERNPLLLPASNVNPNPLCKAAIADLMRQERLCPSKSEIARLLLQHNT